MTRESVPKEPSKSANGAQTRLLESAMNTFGRCGYDAATTRMIAKEAGVNISAIPYYFNGKKGLYHAVVKHAADLIAGQIAETREEMTKQSYIAPLSQEQAVNLLEKFINQLISFIVGSPKAHRVARIILREQMYPTDAYDLIFNGFMSCSIDAIANLVMTISNNTSKKIATLRTIALIGQVLAFRVTRETVVRALDMHGYNQDETEEIRTIIIEHTRSILLALTHTAAPPPEEKP